MTTSTKRTIMFLADSYCGEYQSVLRNSVDAATKQFNIDYQFVVGRQLDAPWDSQRIQNEIFDHISLKNISGVCVMSSSLSNHCSLERLTSFCHQFTEVPVCSFGIEIEGIPSVVVNNDCYDIIVSHLEDTHLRTNFAFIGGPKNNVEAQIRRRSLIDALEHCHMPLDPDLEYYGNFLFQSGINGVNEFFNKGKPFDALVVASDEMALGALKALKEHHKYIPEDICVIGFDDSPQSRFSTPRLATMRQPLDAMAHKMIELLLLAMKGGIIPQRTTIDPYFVPRQSCGCCDDATEYCSQSTGFVSYPPQSFWEDGDESAQRQQLEAFLHKNVHIPNSAYSHWADRMAHALFDEIHGKRGRFLTALQSILEDSEYNPWITDELQSAITSLRKAFKNQSTYDRLDLEDVWHQARNTLFNALAYSHLNIRQDLITSVRMATQRADSAFEQHTGKNVSATQRRDDLFASIVEEFETVGIKNALVTEFIDDTHRLQRSLLVLKEGTVQRHSPALFPANELVPDFMLDATVRQRFTVFLLSTNTRSIGHLVLEQGMAENYYEVLCKYISDALSTDR